MNNVMRVLVTPLQNKRGTAAFPESGRSNCWKGRQIKVRFWPKADIKKNAAVWLYSCFCRSYREVED
ncbi:MAG: hypothetical protein V3R21_01845, partial [Woeseiaceae bacterium]